ncbi:MAG: universal stress protein [Burkholderiales bacterium]|nr:universal stress protein [Burkholderiales bacterium]
MIRKILCATDGSIASAKAVDVAVDLASQLGAALAFVTVERVTAETAANSAFWDSQVLDAAAAQTHRDLSAAQAKARAAGLTQVQCVTTQGGNVAAALIDYAEKHGFDHIVTGSLGRTGLARLMLGSVAADVVAKAHCPVTVVR